MRGPIKSRPVI